MVSFVIAFSCFSAWGGCWVIGEFFSKGLLADTFDVLRTLSALSPTGDELVASGVAKAITCSSLGTFGSQVLRDELRALRSVWKQLHADGPVLARFCEQLRVYPDFLGSAVPVEVALALRATDFDCLGALDEADASLFDAFPAHVRAAVRALIVLFTERGRGADETVARKRARSAVRLCFAL